LPFQDGADVIWTDLLSKAKSKIVEGLEQLVIGWKSLLSAPLEI